MQIILFTTRFFNERQSAIVPIKRRIATEEKNIQYIGRVSSTRFLFNFKSPKKFLISIIPIIYSHLLLLLLFSSLLLSLHTVCCSSMQCKPWYGVQAKVSGFRHAHTRRTHTPNRADILDGTFLLFRIYQLVVVFFVVSCVFLQRKQVSVSIN